jgi:hypothetical protein
MGGVATNHTESPRADRSAGDRVLLGLLVVSVVVSAIHYTDNTIRFDAYPQAEPHLVYQPMIPLSWVLFTAAGVLGYRAYRRGRYRAAAGLLALYSVSGLISPLHYLAAPPGDFDAAQNLFIAGDAVVGLAVLAFAVGILVVPGMRPVRV